MARRWRYPKARRGTFFRLVTDIDDVPYATHARRQRSLPPVPRRGRQWGTVRPQVNPPRPTQTLARHRTYAPAPWRHGHTWAPPWPAQQAAQAPPFPPPALDNRHQRTLLVRKFRTWDAPLDQPAAQPPALDNRHQRTTGARRYRTWDAPLDQPSITAQLDPRHPRLAAIRRGRAWAPVPAPVAPASPPAYPPQWLTQRRVLLALRRGRQWGAVPAPVTVTPPAYQPQWLTRRRSMSTATRRGHGWQVVPAPVMTAPTLAPRWVATRRRQLPPPPRRHLVSWTPPPQLDRPMTRRTRVPRPPVVRRSRLRVTVQDMPRPIQTLLQPRRKLRTACPRRGHGWQPVPATGQVPTVGVLRAYVFGPQVAWWAGTPAHDWVTSAASTNWGTGVTTSVWRARLPLSNWTVTAPEVHP
jgi:hypothetical protein